MWGDLGTNPPRLQPQRGTWSGEEEDGARKKLGKTGKSQEKPHLPGSTEHDLLAKQFVRQKMQILEEEEGNGAAGGKGGPG